jgi:hypothetical protein
MNKRVINLLRPAFKARPDIENLQRFSVPDFVRKRLGADFRDGHFSFFLVYILK